MPNSQLPEYLQFHGQAQKTGCLSATNDNGTSGQLYLHNGKVVYAETGNDNGMLALFTILLWDSPSIDWNEDISPPSMLFSESIDALLFQLAQLEDNGQTDPKSLASIFEASKRNSESIKLTDLKNYTISFEVLNKDFKGFIFYLQKEKTLVGRNEDCDVILPDPSVSGHHAVLLIENQYVRLTDLGSTNGCFVKEKLINDEILQVGDQITIGAVQLQMSLKMQRRLATNSQAAETPNSDSAAKAIEVTTKIDPQIVREKTAKISGPITWKNLGEDEEKKEKVTGLLGKMFNKK